jgi:hydroxymethylglutaryl-CoA reductase
MDVNDLLNGGLKLNVADTMTENVIGLLSLPLSVVPEFVINKKKIMIPMCIEEPSVVAACSSIGKFIAPFSFSSSSTPSIMTGQVHIPSC